MRHGSPLCPWSIQDNAAISVDLFFVLSGFVIAHSYGKRLQSGMTFLEYMGRRLIRLYPMFLIGVLIGTPVLYFIAKAGLADYSKREIAGSLLYNGLFLPYLATKGAHDLGADTVTFGEIFPTNPPAWSLFFELVASLAFATLFRLTRNSLIKIILISYTALLLSAVLSSFIEYRQNLDIGQGWGTSNFLIGFPRVLFGFSFGVLLYSWLQTEYYNKVGAFVRQYVGSPYLLYGILLVIVAFPKIPGIFGDLYPVLILVSVVPCLVFIGSAMRCKGGFDFRVSKFFGMDIVSGILFAFPDRTRCLLVGRHGSLVTVGSRVCIDRGDFLGRGRSYAILRGAGAKIPDKKASRLC